MKNIFKTSVIAVVAAALMAVPLMLSAAGCNVSTASLSNIKICEQPNGELCSSDMSTIDKNTSAFYVTADLDSAPADTKIKIVWRYLSGEIGNEPQDIDSVTLVAEEDAKNIQSSLERAAEVWPQGEYEVVLAIQTDNAEPIHKKFSVK